MHTDSLNYLKSIGIDVKPAESPDLWNFLEEQVVRPSHIGHRFIAMPPAIVADVIVQGENALLDAMVVQHLRDGKIGEVSEVIEMPFVVGTNGSIMIAEDNHSDMLDLIEQPGTHQEHIIHVLLTEAEAIPSTHRVTVKGGLYVDGHTAGYYDLYPGDADDPAAQAKQARLATSYEIKTLALDMEENIDGIAIVTQRECEAMIARVKELLG